MSGSQYLSNTRASLFSIEDDVDDEEFLRHPQSGRSGYMINSPNNPSNDTRPSIDDLRQHQLEKQREIQDRIAKTSQRSLSLLRNSEEIGISTAEELLRQREQLERTEKRLDEINTTLRFSQKHIQGIKSVFGSFKNYLSGKTNGDTQTNRSKLDSPTSNSSKTLMKAVDQTKPFASAAPQDHPGLRVRGLTAESSYADAHDPETQINENLDEMVHSIVRLKGLASGLGEEIDAQNELVESVIGKTEKADITLRRQNKDITRLLH